MSTSSAATYTWDGAGINTNWSTAENWNPDGAPASANTTILSFAQTPSNFNPVADTAWTVNTINLASSATAGTPWNLTGQTLTFAGTSAAINVTSVATSTVVNVIDNDIALNTGVTITVGNPSNVSAVLYMTGDISGTGSLAIGGQLGTLRLTGNNSFSGGVTLSRMSTFIGSDTALGTGTLTFAGTGGSYGMGGVGTTVYTLANAIANRDALADLSGSTRLTGNLTFNGGLEIGNTAVATRQSREIRAGQNSSIIFNGNVTAAAGTSGAAQNLWVGGSTSFSSEGSSRANQANTKMSFNGNGSYTGQTILGSTGSGTSRQYGTVFFNGDFSSSSETIVRNGMAIRGTGIVKAITAGAGTTVSPGGSASNAAAIGTLTVVGGLTINGGIDQTPDELSIMRFNLGTAGTTSRINITNGASVAGAPLTLTGNVTLTLVTSNLANLSMAYSLVTWDEAVTPDSYGSFVTITLGTTDTNGTALNWTNSGYWIEYRSNSIVLVPEPSTYALIAAAGVVFMVFRRRRQVA